MQGHARAHVFIVGSFPVVAVHSPIAIELRLPDWMHQNIHPVFHPMYLQLAGTKTVQPNLKQMLGNVLAPTDYGVERILAHRTVRGATEYLVQWEGCSYLQSTYEPESNLAFAQSKLSAYQNKRRQIETDVSCVLCEDPLRSGQIFVDSYNPTRLHTTDYNVDNVDA